MTMTHGGTATAPAMIPTATHINMELQEVIKLLATPIAEAVVEKLTKKEIDPLKSRVAALEKVKNRYGAQLDLLWKIGVIIVAAIELLQRLHLIK